MLVAVTGSGTKAGSFYAQQEGERKLSPPRPLGNHHVKDVGDNGAVESHSLAESPLQSGLVALYHLGLEEGPANPKLSSTSSIKGKKGIAWSRAHQTSLKLPKGSSATLHSSSSTYPSASNHGEPMPRFSHKFQLEPGVRPEMDFQFTGGSDNNRQDIHKLGYSGVMRGEPDQVSIREEGCGITAESYMLHGEQGNHHTPAASPITHGAQSFCVRTKAENGSVATQGATGARLGLDVGEFGQDRMQLEEGDDVSTVC